MCTVALIYSVCASIFVKENRPLLAKILIYITENFIGKPLWLLALLQVVFRAITRKHV